MAFLQVNKPIYKWVCDFCGNDIDVNQIVTFSIQDHSEGLGSYKKNFHAHKECLSGVTILAVLERDVVE